MQESKNVTTPTAEQTVGAEYILEVENLKKYFPIKKNLLGKATLSLKAVDDVSFRLKKGTTIGVVGESGCGKTTLGRTILKLYSPDGGKIMFNGTDLTNLKKRRCANIVRRYSLFFRTRIPACRRE